MLYPVLCSPVYKEMIWGGSRLQEIYGRKIPSDKTGESWDITCREKEMSVIENGPDAGMTLAEWFEADSAGTLGDSGKNADGVNGKAPNIGGAAAPIRETFPLLVKIIDAQENLSVQVHPNDAYAAKNSNAKSDSRDREGSSGSCGERAGSTNERGKSEMWYVMQAPEDGALIIGLREGVTRDALRRACETGEVEPCLNRLQVKKGDLINIPAGLVHALTRGVMVAEIQQNSDTTYRLFDYNRPGLDGKPRALHIKESLDVTDFENKIPKEVTRGNIIENEFFRAEKIEINAPQQFATNKQTFTLITCAEESCFIAWSGGTVEVPASRTAFIPAKLGNYKITGNCTILKTTLPNQQQSKA